MGLRGEQKGYWMVSVKNIFYIINDKGSLSSQADHCLCCIFIDLKMHIVHLSLGSIYVLFGILLVYMLWVNVTCVSIKSLKSSSSKYIYFWQKVADNRSLEACFYWTLISSYPSVAYRCHDIRF
jgi:hypothetical protein